MTIIAAVRKNGRAAIAADTQHNLDHTIIAAANRRHPDKIERIGDAFIGTVGNSSHALVLRSIAARHPDLMDFSSEDAIFETLLAMHPILKDDYYLSPQEGEKQEYESNHLDGLIVSPGGIFSFLSFREVTEHTRFWATGSGETFALGALEATYDTIDDPRALAELAVRVACAFDDGCGLPLTSHALDLED